MSKEVIINTIDTIKQMVMTEKGITNKGAYLVLLDDIFIELEKGDNI